MIFCTLQLRRIMKKQEELMKYVGSMQQVAYVRPLIYTEGRSTQLRAYDVKNGPMQFQVMCDKALDVSQLSYGGVNINFLSKPGLQGRNQYDTNGDEAVRSIMGGLFFTSGVENICAPCRIHGVDYPMHGRMRTTPAEHVGADACWKNGDYELSVSGEMREAALFGENMVLRRRISTIYGTKTLTVSDEFVNEGFREEPLMLLYHINLGYPFLDEHTRLYIHTKKVTPRDQQAAGHEERYDRMDAPRDNEPEYVFIHDIMDQEGGRNEVLAVNEPLGLGLRLSYSMKNLPYFMEWKSVASGDYVIGLEPANSSVYGRPWHEERQSVHLLPPFATERNELTFTVLDGENEIKEAVSRFEAAGQDQPG